MRFETEEAREAYRRGVRDTLDQAHVHIAQPSIRELEHWLKISAGELETEAQEEAKPAGS